MRKRTWNSLMFVRQLVPILAWSGRKDAIQLQSVRELFAILVMLIRSYRGSTYAI
jgi:hypothetical protein